MDLPILLNQIFNLLIFAFFSLGLGLGNAHLDKLYSVYLIYAYCLIIIPIAAYILRRHIKSDLIKKLLLFLSLTYFIWGYIIMDFWRASF